MRLVLLLQHTVVEEQMKRVRGFGRQGELIPQSHYGFNKYSSSVTDDRKKKIL